MMQHIKPNVAADKGAQNFSVKALLRTAEEQPLQAVNGHPMHQQAPCSGLLSSWLLAGAPS